MTAITGIKNSRAQKLCMIFIVLFSHILRPSESKSWKCAKTVYLYAGVYEKIIFVQYFIVKCAMLPIDPFTKKTKFY